MKEIRTYHCNNCGAFLMIGEKHSCDRARVDLIGRISDFLSQSQTQHQHIDIEMQEEGDGESVDRS
ncbi:MAG: hypothetical protein AB1489_23100 [Acidobacteriota bacterium]